jgi:serine/threonine protein kinase/Tfp pilus assembly protein PilF
MQPMIGVRIGRYELLRRLGAGAMGEVYLGRDHSLGRQVAIKFLPQSFASDPDRIARFANEAKAASSLNHPNIVTIHELGEIDNTSYIVMEYVEGVTLRETLRKGPLEPARAYDYAAQIADGLAKAHAAGIVHRDLKPENLMITPDGFVKILDFGLAKLYSEEKVASAQAGSNASTASALAFLPTASGMVVGTVGYMSPEQASGQPVNFRSDQFAFGTILYEMTTGRRAFQRATAVQTLNAIIEAEPEDYSFPAEVSHILKLCLMKDPQKRYESTADLASDLHKLQKRTPAKTCFSKLASYKRLFRGWRRIALILAFVLLILILTPAGEAVLEFLHMLPIPSERRIAVLPFQYIGSNNEDRMLCDGILPYLTARLGELERFQHFVSVVPASEVRNSGVKDAATAKRTLGVRIAVEGGLQRTKNGFAFNASLTDTSKHRQLRAIAFSISEGKAPLLEKISDSVVEMLDLGLRPEEKSAFHVGGTAVAEASTAYGRALGYTAYQQANTKLEQNEQEQNLEKAIRFYMDALRQDPNFALAHAGIGEAYWRLSRFTHKSDQVDLAEENCRHALKLDDSLVAARITLGSLLAGTDRIKEGMQALQRAINQDPRNAVAYRERANVFHKLNRESEAEADYRKAIALDPESWVARSWFGAYLLKLGRYPEAENQYSEALRIVPENARILSGLGSAYYLQQQYVKARNAWNKSMELSPTSIVASNLALCLFFEGRYSEAASRLERAIKIDDRDYRVWRNLAAAHYWSPGLRQKAAKEYRKAADLAENERSLDPADPRVWVDLADCYAMLQQKPEALKAVAEASRLGSRQNEIARGIAEVYEKLGNRDMALTWISTALKLGAPKDEIERNPGLSELRKDSRYQKLIKSEPHGADPNDKADGGQNGK